MTSVSAAAIAYACAGYPAVAIGAQGKPTEKAWPDFTPDPDETARRFERLRPFGIAIVNDQSRFVIDLDRGHAAGVDGVAEFAKFIPPGEALTDCPRARTKRDGRHLYFRKPEGVIVKSSAGVLAPGVDVRAARTCVKVWPTPGYHWIRSILDFPPPMAPDWLLALVAEKPCPPSLPSPRQSYAGTADRLAQHVFRDEVMKVAKAKTGTRNAQLFASAATLGGLCAGGELPEQEIKSALFIAARDCGLVKDEGKRTVESAINRAFSRGNQKPRNLNHLRTETREARHG